MGYAAAPTGQGLVGQAEAAAGGTVYVPAAKRRRTAEEKAAAEEKRQQLQVGVGSAGYPVRQCSALALPSMKLSCVLQVPPMLLDPARSAIYVCSDLQSFVHVELWHCTTLLRVCAACCGHE